MFEIHNFVFRKNFKSCYFAVFINLRQFPPGDFSYQDNLNRITTPLLLIAGGADLLVPPFRVKYVFDNIASTEKEFIVCSKANGFREDYGHGDLTLGADATDEILPKIINWIE